MASESGEWARERAGDASLDERLAIRRGVYTMVDALVDGFLARLEQGGFAEATRRELAGRRFEAGHAVFAEAIAVAFPQYARLAKASFDGRGGGLRERDGRDRREGDTDFDPYRIEPTGFDFQDYELAETGQTVEIVVLLESLDCYNEIVRMFYEGSADEVHELEQVRRHFQKRYRDLVTLEELKAANRPDQASVDADAPPKARAVAQVDPAAEDTVVDVIRRLLNAARWQ